MNPSKALNARHIEQDSKTITCEDCKKTFEFTKGEEEFYQSKGLTEPKRCKACRATAAARRQETRAAAKERTATAIDREKAKMPGK